MTTEQTVLGAVKTDRVTSRRGLLQKLFSVWFDAFVYNQIWEDPRVDLQALQLNGDSRVLTISSCGCNALNYLIENPESVTAVDLNAYHIYLLQLKLAALQFLPTYEDFFAFFGFGKHKRNVANLRRGKSGQWIAVKSVEVSRAKNHIPKSLFLLNCLAARF